VTVDGGSAVLSYSLEVDDGMGGDFIALYGVSTNSLSLTYTFINGVSRGLTFRARYRARNAVGWSDYSSTGYIIAAVAPSAPPAPVFVSADSDTIIL
jgi:hypothetical protein